MIGNQFILRMMYVVSFLMSEVIKVSFKRYRQKYSLCSKLHVPKTESKKKKWNIKYDTLCQSSVMTLSVMLNSIHIGYSLKSELKFSWHNQVLNKVHLFIPVQ